MLMVPYLVAQRILVVKTKAKKKVLPQDFKSVAKRLECDEDKARFEAKLGKIAKAKLKPKRR